MKALLATSRTAEPRFFAIAVVLAISMLPTALAALLDDRQFNGIDVWTKTLKFQSALAVYAVTLAWFARWIAPGQRASTGYRAFSIAVVIAIVYETIAIGGGSALATASHFNPTPIGALVYAAMGIGAVLLTSATGVQAWLIARNPDTGLPLVVREGLVAGLALTLPLTLVTAGTLSALGGHWIGGTPSDTGGLALMGWSRTGGDLRVSHFFATHAMHAIPAAGWLIHRFAGDRPGLLRAAIAGWLGLVGWTYVQALAGRPFLG